MTVINIRKAVDLINSTNGKAFGVEFIKRTTGELRKMAARLGVKKGVTGKGLSYDPSKKNLVPVYDMNNGFRMIPLEGIQVLRVEGVEYKIA